MNIQEYRIKSLTGPVLWETQYILLNRYTIGSTKIILRWRKHNVEIDNRKLLIFDVMSGINKINTKKSIPHNQIYQ